MSKDRRFDIQGADTIDVAVLDTFPYEYQGKRCELNISTNEFTAVCPWSGLPDFATVTIKYVPDKKCIELKSLKYYLHTFRNVGMYQEHVVNRVLQDLVDCCDPVEMTVILDYTIRGGIHTVATVSYARS